SSPLSSCCAHRDLPSFPTRRSSDLDKALIVLLNTTRGEAVFTTAGPARSVGSATIPVPSEYSGEDVEVFLGFVSEDGTKVANSRSEEHTSELQSRENLVCRLLLEKK